MEHKCEVKNCTKKRNNYELFTSPRNEMVARKWRKAVGTNKHTFFVCEYHFNKNDVVVKKNLKTLAVPELNLDDDGIKIENNCCGLCLEDYEEYHEIQTEYKEIFSEITGYGPLTDLICNECEQAIIKYKKFLTEIKQNHDHIRKMVCNQIEDEYTIVENESNHPAVPNITVVSSLLSCKYCTRFKTNEQLKMFDHIRDNHSFQCDQCRFFCARATELGNHVLAHHVERENLYCGICKITGFLNTAILDIHKETSHRIGKFHCRFCPIFFMSAESLRVHIAFTHSYSDRMKLKNAKKHQIPLEVHNRKQTLNQNLNSKLEQSVLKNPEFLNVPSISSTTIILPHANDPLLTIQSSEIKKELEETEISEVVKIDTETVHTIKEEHMDELSSESTISQTEEIDELEELIAEMPENSSEKEMNVNPELIDEIVKEEQIEIKKECEKEEISEEKHKEEHVKCLDCRKLMHVTDLLEHRLKEHAEPEFKEYETMPDPFTPRFYRPRYSKPPNYENCPYCDQEMLAKDKISHIRQYHKDKPKPLLCHICSKDFYEQRNLDAHVRWHNPELQYTCDLCGVKFVRKHYINEHIKKHHLNMNVHPHQCKICLKTSMDPIERHMKKYHKNGYDCGARVNSETNYYDCCKCGASYVDLFTFRRHDCEKGRFQIRCNDCQRPVKNMEFLKYHQRYKCYKSTKRGYLVQPTFVGPKKL